MISEGGTQLYRALLLRARDAARRFVPRRVKGQAREIGWRPIVLRWAKRGKHLTRAILRHVTGPAKFVSSPQFHFRFASYQTKQSLTNVSRVRTTSTRVFGTRIVRDEVGATVRPTNLSPERLANRSRRATNRAPQSTRELRRPETPFLRASKTTRAHPVSPPLIHPRKYLFSRPSISAARPLTAKKDVVTPISQSRIIHWTSSFAPRSRNQSSGHSERARESTVLTQYQRTEELVWRRLSKTTTDITERVRHLESIVSSEQPSSRSASSQQSTVAVASAMEAVAAMPVTKLDPALMDRLANDVIRRVEQRVRIERERRGL